MDHHKNLHSLPCTLELLLGPATSRRLPSSDTLLVHVIRVGFLEFITVALGIMVPSMVLSFVWFPSFREQSLESLGGSLFGPRQEICKSAATRVHGCLSAVLSE